MTKNTFGTWLKGALDERNLRPVDLARRANMDTGIVSNLIHGKRNAGIDSCTAIAKALQIPVEEPLRAAGLMPPDPLSNPLIARIMNLVAQLPDEQALEVHEYIKLRLSLSQRPKLAKPSRTMRGHPTS